jgi:hypothetical protein
VKSLIIIIAFFALSTVAFADWALPQSQQTPETRLWLAKAMVSEVGWPTDHVKMQEQVAVGYVLLTRWKQISRNKNRANLKLITVAKYYCSAFNPNKKEPERKWLIYLDYSLEQPAYWPSNASWKKHKRLWTKTIRLADRVMRKEVRNPCPGANHFGGLRAGDIPEGRMVRHKCSEVFERHKRPGNTFYFLRRTLQTLSSLSYMSRSASRTKYMVAAHPSTNETIPIKAVIKRVIDVSFDSFL